MVLTSNTKAHHKLYSKVIIIFKRVCDKGEGNGLNDDINSLFNFSFTV